jgi:radical SAM protein with 4Fe4S-binding SPASM domain
MTNDPCLYEHVDDFSFELQKYLLPNQYNQYTEIIGNPNAEYVKGYVHEVNDFATIDFKLLDLSLNNIKNLCKEKGKGFFTNPDKLSLSDIEHYFSANWEKMSVSHKSCIFPFVYAEITAQGNVVLCHSFYDDVLGNIHQQSLLEVWNNKKARDFRKSIRKELLPICYACCSYFNSENRA